MTRQKRLRYRCIVCDHAVYEEPHKCPTSVIGAADAAETRAALDELDPTRVRNEFWRCEGQRLSDGFDLLNLDD